MSDDRRLLDGEAAERSGEWVAAAAAYGAAAAAADGDPAVAGEALFRLGRLHWRQGKHDRALGCYARARSVAERSGDSELRARIENGVGAVHYARGEYAQARASYQVALDLTTDDAQRGKITLNLAVIANIEGDLDRARAAYQKARDLLKRGADDATLALVLHNLGMLHADRAAWDEAADSYRQCLVLCERHGNAQLVGTVLVNRAELHCAAARPADAVVDCERALAIFAELGDLAGRGEAMRWLGRALRLGGDGARAERVLQDGYKLAARIHGELLRAECAFELGTLEHERRSARVARQWLDEALARFRALGAVREIEDTERALAALTGG